MLDQTAEGFAERLREVCGRQRPTLYFEAVGGDLTAMVMDALPDGAETIIYGALNSASVAVASASIRPLPFRAQRVTGFWLPVYLRRTALPKVLRMAADVQRLFADGSFTTRVAGTSSLEDFRRRSTPMWRICRPSKRFALTRQS